MNRRAALIGKHWLIEMYQAPKLDDVAHIRRALRRAVAGSGVRLIRLQLHHFGAGRGVTGVALLAESHISIHTWPERHLTSSCADERAIRRRPSMRCAKHLSPPGCGCGGSDADPKQLQLFPCLPCSVTKGRQRAVPREAGESL
jgi:hypothetical protein